MGTAYEKMAGEYLKTQGYEILQYNFRCRMGEIDIIAKDHGYLVFIEVKYRRDKSCGHPAEAVTPRKQRTISKVASYYLLTHGCGMLKYNNTARRKMQENFSAGKKKGGFHMLFKKSGK